jgi:hypothetical protein
MLKIKFSLKLNSLLISLLFLLNYCNDLPTELAFGLVYDTINVYPITSSEVNFLLFSKNQLFRQNRLNTGVLFCGKSQNINALSLIRFGDIPDTLAYVSSDRIISATLTLRPFRYAFGDTLNGTMGLRIYKVQKLWTISVSWDSLINNDIPTDYFDLSRVIGQWSGKIQLKDTMDAISIDIDKNLIAEWFKLHSDSLPDFGIGLLPENYSNVIYSFKEQVAGGINDFRPIIKVVYKNKNDNNDSVTFKSAMGSAFINDSKPDDNSLTIQGSVCYGSQLFFDVSFFPYLTSVHLAELILTLDPSRSYKGNVPLDSTLSVLLLSGDSVNSDTLRYYYAQRISGTDKFKVSSIASAIETWNRGAKKGNLIFLPEGYVNEFQEFERLVFYGPEEPDSAKKPRLRIIYSTRPHFDSSNNCKKK